ncbi:MAG: hypothetical protein GF334_06535 [Candidatus Altiarchaeales archaeon]|nr:hypothetical protein [Candidatus Altiarchaeales archaeon]
MEKVSLLDKALAEDLERALDRRGILHSEWDPEGISLKGESSAKGLLRALLDAPETHLDPSIVEDIRGLLSHDVIFPSNIQLLLDRCAFSSLASGFGMTTLLVVKEMIEKGG